MPANNDADYSSVNQPDPKPGPFLAKVVSNIDPTYMGVLEVEILHPIGGTTSEGQLHQVKYMSPFYGQTSVVYNGETTDYNNTQKSYGMWAVPPDVGATVIIIFIDGDPKRGYWIGCVPDENMDFMTPGLASTEAVLEGPYSTLLGDSATRVPVAEYNKVDPVNDSPTNSTTLLKPTHPFTDVLDNQGLLLDDTRGITTSSARRESPSMVFGISTPGPLDKQDGAQTGNYGKPEHIVTGAPVSRLGGTTFVMDDGDDKFLRKTAPTDGPPDYASLEERETDGDVLRPHNELFRIRTRTGHQILFHNTEDLIYITNSRGTAWIELTSDGKIDIYAQDSISVRTQNDLNFYADRDINMEAGRNFNLKVAERHQTEVGMDKICIVNGNVAIQVDGTHDEQIAGTTQLTVTGGDFNLNTSGGNNFTSGGDMQISAANTAIDGGNINLNSGKASASGTATPPDPLPTIDNPTEVDGTTITSIMARVPTTEPYPHHENLDATMFKPDATDREAATAIDVPPAWKQYSTKIDTFARNPPPADEDQTGA
jgi:hypothetical protein